MAFHLVLLLSLVEFGLAVRRSGQETAHFEPLKRCSAEAEAQCCSCGGQVGGACVQETGGVNPATGQSQYIFKPCCHEWASECSPTDGLWQQGFRFECDFRPYQRGLYPDEYEVEGKCKKAECSSVYAALDKTMSELRSHNQFWFKTGLATGYSNSKWNNKCACGEFNEATRQCATTGRWGKSKEKPCCTNLQDCKPLDPWPTRFDKEFQNEEALKQKATTLQGLSAECLQSCNLKYQELCLADLKEKVPGSKVSRQEAFRLEVEKLGPRPGDYDRKVMDYELNIEKKMQAEKEERVRRIHKKISEGPILELIDLSSWDGSLETGSSGACCKCRKAHPFGDIPLGASITHFCSASTCSNVPDCESIDNSFCGKNAKSCW